MLENIIGEKLFPSIPLHPFLSIHSKQKVFNNYVSKNFTPKKNISPILSQHVENNNYASQTIFSIFSHLPESIQPPCIHALHSSTHCVRLCTVYRKRCCYVTSSSGCHTHPVLRRGTWETLQCQECGVKVVPFRAEAILKRPKRSCSTTECTRLRANDHVTGIKG